MRKILPLFFACLFATTAFNVLNAQCIPIPNIIPIYPAPNSALATGTVGTAYGPFGLGQSINLSVPADTLYDFNGFPGVPQWIPFPPVNLPMNSQSVVSITGLPPGLTWACYQQNCNILAGNNSCVSITGTPTVAGSYNVTFNTSYNVTIPDSIGGFPTTPFGGAQDLPAVPFPYTIDINTVGIADDLNPNRFQMGQNVPNPAANSTTIIFTHPQPSKVELRICNLVGQLQMREIFIAGSGLNEREISTAGLPEGVYFYSLDNGNEVLTRKMVLSR